MKNVTKKVLLLVLVILAMVSGEIFATSEFKEIKKSAEFEKWENLKDEERTNTIQPPYQTITFKNNIRRSRYNYLLNLRESNQEASYPKQETALNLKVKDQGSTGTCWAFSYSTILEAIYKKKININREYSPMHIELKSAKMFNRTIDTGGNIYLALAYSTSGNGPVLENDMPISSVYNETEGTYISNVENLDLNKTVTGQVTEAKLLPALYKTYSGNQLEYSDGENAYTEQQVEAIREVIKECIKENGAISACMYSDIQIDAEGNYISDYFNAETAAYYCDAADEGANHAVTIIGWDDGYQVENFKEGKRPSKNGAYIILNSYGSEFGKNGYMYVSYEDFAIEQVLAGIEGVKEQKEYDKIYQYDELGANYAISTGSASIYAANIFTRDTANINEDEYLEEVGIYLLSTEGVEVYFSDNENLTGYKQIAAPGVLEPGYHTIKISTPQKLTKDKFAIIIKYTNSEEGAAIPIETDLHESGFSYVEDFYSTATANEGESKYSLNGTTWNELNNTKIGLMAELKNTNNCIKAFTTYQDKASIVEVTDVELSEESIELEKGKTETLLATVAPENATNKTVFWNSSNNSIATVENGVVTGVSEGTAIITVTTEDGNKTDSCEVKVVAGEVQTPTINVTNVNIDLQLAEGTTLIVKKGATHTVNAVVEPSNATNKRVTWSSSNENIATVTGGIIKGISEGNATITVTTEDGNKTDSINVVVEPNTTNINVESINLDKSMLELEVGDETNLVVSFNPTNVSNKNVEWSSSNTNVATISETGIIKAISEGKTIITVTSEDGNKTAKCELTVVKKKNTADDIYKDNENNSNTNDFEDNQNDDTGNKKDDTLAKDELPNTGLKIVLTVLGIGIVLIAIRSFIKFRKFIDIK